jgi:hypothetical protein
MAGKADKLLTKPNPKEEDTSETSISTKTDYPLDDDLPPFVSPIDSETPETTPALSLKVKCVKCCTRLLRDGCTQMACLICCDDISNCEAHRKPRLQAEFKASIMEGTHFIQQEAARIRARRIPPMARRLLNIREPSILYQGDTVVIWDIRAYGANSKWKDDATRKSIRRTISEKSASTSNVRSKRLNKICNNEEVQSHHITKRLRNDRNRFHRITEELYLSSCRKANSGSTQDTESPEKPDVDENS